MNTSNTSVQAAAGRAAASARVLREPPGIPDPSPGEANGSVSSTLPATRQRKLMFLSARDFYLFQLLFAVDVVAVELAYGILGWSFPPRSEQGLHRSRRRRLYGLLKAHLAVQIARTSLTRIHIGEKLVLQALATLRSGNIAPPTPEDIPFLDNATLNPVLDHLADAVIRRVVEQRDGTRGDGKVAAWLADLREACLAVQPRLITPSLELRSFDGMIAKFRASVGLPSVTELKVRRSHRKLGRARLRVWGLGEDVA